MSAERATERAPYFTTYSEVEVDVSPEDLQAAGWVYVGVRKTGTGAIKEPMTESRFDFLVREFHNAEHEGPMLWCRHDLCIEVVR